MNQFIFTTENEDLGSTPIENLFINHYLPKAPGDFVKIYILGLKFCFHGTGSISNEVISKTLDLLESDVIKAWNYWENQGIIKRQSNDNGEDVISFLSIKEVVLNKTSLLNKKEPKNSPTEIVASRKNNKVKEMHNMIENMYGRPLSSIEMSLYHRWMTDYGFSPEVIILLLEDCFSRGRKESAYIKRVALNWYDSGVKTPEDAEKYMVIHKEKWEKYFKVMSCLGFKRQPTQKEEELMNKWFFEYHMPLDMVLEACSKTAAINQPNFRYIDKIITDWHNSGFVSLEQTKEENSPASKKPKYSSTKTTKKTNSKLDLDHNYDMDNLEKKLLNRNRSDISD